MLLKLWVDIVVVFKIILATRNYVRMNMSNCLSRFRAVLNRNRRRVSFQGSSAKCFLSQLRFAGSWPRHVISPFLCENLWKNSLYFKTRAHQKLILQLFQPFEQPEKDLILLLASDLRKAAHPDWRYKNMSRENRLQIDKRETFGRLVENATGRNCDIFWEQSCHYVGKNTLKRFLLNRSVFIIAIFQKYRRFLKKIVFSYM